MWLFDKEYDDNGMDSFMDDEGIDVFIGDLPNKVTVYDVEKLLGEYTADAALKFSTKLFSDGSAIYFCVAPFSSRKRGEKAMKMLQNKKLAGDRLKIHEFHHRSYNNDRRFSPFCLVDEHDSEKRNTERRRQESFALQSMM